MYTSGRTVKSTVKRQSAESAATAAARRLVRRHLPPYVNAIISSKKVAGTDGTVRMSTEILFSELSKTLSKPLSDAVMQLPGYHSQCWNLVSVSYLIDL